jgi:hypothetical protein
LKSGTDKRKAVNTNMAVKAAIFGKNKNIFHLTGDFLRPFPAQAACKGCNLQQDAVTVIVSDAARPCQKSPQFRVWGKSQKEPKKGKQSREAGNNAGYFAIHVSIMVPDAKIA